MKKLKFCFLFLSSALLLVISGGCTKTNGDGNLYTPTSSDVTATATLPELQQGRALYISNCGSCHNLYSPDDFSATRWRSIMNSMAPETRMTSSEITLTTKYVTRGQ